MFKLLKSFLIGLTFLILLSGCGNEVEEIIGKGKDVVNEVEEVVDKGKGVINEVREVGSTVNEVVTSMDGKVQAVKSSPVYDYGITFEELFNTTLQYTKWESNKDKNEVIVTGEFKDFLYEPVFKGDSELEKERQELLDKYLFDPPTTYTIIFPFFGDSDVPTVNMAIFSEVDAYFTKNGKQYDVNGQELVSILAEVYNVLQ